MGHTLTHLPQRMQAGCSTVRSSSSQKARMALVPLPMGASMSYWACPIMGPPIRILKVLFFTPPQASSSSWMGAPMGHSRFLGSLTPEPDTVTTRWVTGMPVYTAR